MNALINERYNQASSITSFDISKIHNRLSGNLLINPKGWTYLIANNIRFSNKQDYSIHLPKPHKATLINWLIKIAESGRAQNVFVEALELNEPEALRLLNIFNFYGVRLINIDNKSDNQLVYGPWD